MSSFTLTPVEPEQDNSIMQVPDFEKCFPQASDTDPVCMNEVLQFVCN